LAARIDPARWYWTLGFAGGALIGLSAGLYPLEVLANSPIGSVAGASGGERFACSTHPGLSALVAGFAAQSTLSLPWAKSRATGLGGLQRYVLVGVPFKSRVG